MTRSQVAAGGLLVAQAVVAYALTQPDFVLPPAAKFILGALSVGISTLTLFLKLQPPGPSIAVPDGDKPVGEP